MYLDTSTSPNPSSTLTAMKALTPALAATGVSKVRMAVTKTPIPNSHFPPYFSAKYPPGICVMTYP